MKQFFTILALISFLSNLTPVQAVSNKGFRWDMTFLDFEEITSHFRGHHRQVVHTINHDDSPLVITEAEVSDRGTVFFEGLSGAQNTYSVEVKNNSPRKILAYEVTWVLKHPFEDYVFHKIHTNSIDPVKVGGTQELKFRRNKHYRDDAYYYVEISKVEFDDDESIWEAPELDAYKKGTRLDEVKKQIDEMEDDTGEIDEETLEALKAEYAESLEKDKSNRDLKNKVLLKEIDSTETTTTTTETVTEEVIKDEKVESKTVNETTTIVESSPIVETTVVESSPVVETTVIKSIPVVDPKPILDPQELMKAVDELIRLKKDKNLILQSDLVKTEPVVETKQVVETNPVVETKQVVETSPVVETTIINTQPIVETRSVVETKVIETKTETTVETEPEEDDDEIDDEDFDFDDEFDEDDDIDFGDDDFEDDDF